MKHISYIYIFEYRGIHNVGIRLDTQYEYVVDEKSKRIKIYENPNYITNFWPEGVSSLSAIVGNNGAGKTTCLLYMLQALAEGSGEKELNAIIIYRENGSETNIVYKPNECEYEVEPRVKGIWKTGHRRPTIEMFYYSGYFRPYNNVHEAGVGELKGIYNASDTWKLIKDYQDYSNVDTLPQSEPLGFHIAAMQAQDDNRIVMLLRDRQLREMLPVNAVPRYIYVEPSDSGYKRLQHEFRIKRLEKVDLPQHHFGWEKVDYIAQIVYANFYNYAAEHTNLLEAIISLQQEWARLYDQKKDLYTSLSNMIQRIDLLRIQLMNLIEIVGFLDKACTFNKNTQTLYIDTNSTESDENLKELCTYFSVRDFVVAHYFDLGYAREPIADTRLSSGEYDLLKFFSRLYDATIVQLDRFDNVYTPHLILVDEAENSYHPEWQRQFVNMLVTFVDAIYKQLLKKAIEDKKVDRFGRPLVSAFQLVLTTHSPILLSDIPRMYVNYLEKDEKTGRVTVSKDQPETFGANVFELYRHAFFMSNGLVGEYASKKIIEIQKDIKKGRKTNDVISQEIRLIGDRGIQAYLQDLLEEQ